MNELSTNRRAFLAFGGASIAASMMPAAAVAEPVAATPMPPNLTWIVGTPGEADWSVIRAPTWEMARLFRCEEYTGESECEISDPEACTGCEFCAAFNGYEVERQPQWDALSDEAITHAEWVKAGLEAPCSRCGYEASMDGGGAAVGDEAVCEDCMTIADWEAVDPEYAAELRAEAEPTP